MKRIYGSNPTILKLTGKALKAYNNLSHLTITEYTDRAYKILPEYYDFWCQGLSTDEIESSIIWDTDLEYYADSWETTVSDLLDQLEPVPMYGVTGCIEFHDLVTAEYLVNWLEDGML